jgi:hypothetical protein
MSAGHSVNWITRNTHPFSVGITLAYYYKMTPDDLSHAVREASDTTMSHRRGIVGLSLAVAGSM